MTDRKQRLQAAALDARLRLRAVMWQMDDRTLFAPLGETLMWLVALADLTGVIEDDPYSGLAHARNCLVHGNAVVRVSDIAEQPPFTHSPLRGDAPRFTGQATARIWGFVDDPDPSTSGKHRNREASYARSVARHALGPRLDSALYDLGVDILGAVDLPLAPRRSDL